MAEDTICDALSWSVFIDRLAGPLRLERPDRQAFGVLMSLHLVAEIWGEIALLRAAARLAARHAFALPATFSVPQDADALETWYGGFLRAQLRTEEPVPLPRSLLKPGWAAERRHP